MIISVGKSRKDIRWHNTDIGWYEFLERLREPYRTHETMREYKAMSKDEKGRAKDIGGFVGGALSSGRRKAANVLNRSLVTLDLDDAVSSAWDDAALWGWRMAMYSTHSHTPEQPRLRMVFPLDRVVSVDEYQAIARRVGEYIGIDQLDPSTHEPSRLFYWPSCPSDGEYLFREQDGEVLCADEILRSYGLDDAWKDSRLWPTGKNEAAVRLTEVKKQGDPTEKQGIVGLFCRTYDIHDAISTFLAHIYEEGTAGRYTYLAGSTADGAVIYEDGMFLYSHHGTDPCGGQLVNAFDLVRIHLFGELDDKNDEDLEITAHRSSGAGGQHINKTDSAIRIVHKPTGIVVGCQTERSQLQNKETALKMLKSKLMEIKEREKLERIEDIQGTKVNIEWGSQIRSYVFMPYTLAKDTRTGYEIADIQAVMDGEIDGFINAYLKKMSAAE